jgi:hypothetical protein
MGIGSGSNPSAGSGESPDTRVCVRSRVSQTAGVTNKPIVIKHYNVSPSIALAISSTSVSGIG